MIANSSAKSPFLEWAWTQFLGPAYASRASPKQKLPDMTGSRPFKMRLKDANDVLSSPLEAFECRGMTHCCAYSHSNQSCGAAPPTISRVRPSLSTALKSVLELQV